MPLNESLRSKNVKFPSNSSNEMRCQLVIEVKVLV